MYATLTRCQGHRIRASPPNPYTVKPRYIGRQNPVRYNFSSLSYNGIGKKYKNPIYKRILLI